MPDAKPSEKALRLYPLPTQELNPTTIHRDASIIPHSKDDHTTRPYVVINMVGSVDGKVDKKGKASGIGSGIDRCAMRNLRAKSDAVMVGANTLRAERLSLGLDQGGGSRPEPLAVIVTSAGDVPLGNNLILHEGQAVLVIAGPAMPEDRARRLRARRVGVMRVPATASGQPDLLEALRGLRRDHAVERLLVEGGPILNRALISAGLADEFFLTIAPKLLGGTYPDARNILNDALPTPQDLRLLSVHLAADELFLRYAITGPKTL